MQVSEQWLREWVNPKIDSIALAAQLTMAGLEVDALAPVAKKFSGVIIAQVLATEPHPQADRLRVCQVNTGKKELSIVCGAANVRAGLKVALATDGAQLPNAADKPITETQMRGVLSQGMLCAAEELGLAESSEGLLELDDSAPIGVALWDWLNLNDQSIELGLTPNRGDCLSVLGLAREIAALNQLSISAPEIKSIVASHDHVFPVTIKASKQCPCYLGRVIENIRADATTPVWMAEKLRRSGVRSIHPVVDVTNYVMLELGQPMHAFDLNKLQGGIQVRLAQAGDSIALLDGQTVEVKLTTLVIADEQGPVALAGIMGGENSKVDETTKNIFLESAFFEPIALAGQARSYGLHTDSSHRFERGVDFMLQRQAIERATQLLLEIVGGEAGPLIEKINSAELPKRLPIELQLRPIQQLLGFELPASAVSELLGRLGMEVVTKVAEVWQITPPSYRFDISEPVDLVEEIARLYGYNNIPSRLPALPYNAAIFPPETHTQLAQVKNVFVDRDYQEVITYSFVAPQLQQALYPEQTGLILANPISADLSVMRLGLWPGLIQTAQYNLNRQQNRVRIFETGLVFLPDSKGELQQVLRLGGLITGNRYGKHWRDEQRAVDFFDLKGDVENLIANFLPEVECQWRPAEHTALQPGQTAHIYLGDVCLGWLGALHPALQAQFDVASKVYLFEIHLDWLTQGQLPRVQSLSKFPEVQRDLAFIVDAAISAQSLIDAIKAQDHTLIKAVTLFDVYEGGHMEAGKKSLALNLTIAHPSHTLKDEEVNGLIDDIVRSLQAQFRVTLRE